MQLNEIIGHYVPSFFNIVLETDENTSLAIEKNTPTVLHEIIHYLQDLILPYNIRLNLTNINWFGDIRQFAAKQGKITRPFSDWSSESLTLILQYDYTMGKNNYIATVENIGDAISYVQEASGYDWLYSHKMRNFKVYTYYLPVNNGSFQYNLGARDLLEYIAHKIEIKHCPRTIKFPRLPYESVDLLFEHYGLAHVSEDIRLCIAECCLYNDNPIRFLFHQFLEGPHNQTIAALNFDEVYTFLSTLAIKTTDGVTETLIHKKHRRLQYFADQLTKQYFGFDGIREWILKVNNFVEDKFSERFLFSDMYKMDHNTFFSFIQEVIHIIGLPLVMNEENECVSISQNLDETKTSQFIQLLIFQNFMYFVCSGTHENACPIYHFCRANGDICQDLCATDPFKRIKENPNCPYDIFLKHYGLSNVMFEVLEEKG